MVVPPPAELAGCNCRSVSVAAALSQSVRLGDGEVDPDEKTAARVLFENFGSLESLQVSAKFLSLR
jgi:hypothetical protein